MKRIYIICLLLFFLIANQLVYGQCAITLLINSNKATCPCNNGAAMVTASGGTAPYTYSWTNGTAPGTVTIFPSKDNSIYEQFTGNSNGAGEFMTAGVSAAGFKHRLLISFPITGNVPTGASVTTASLSLNVNLTSGQNGTTNHYLYKVMKDWGEGISNAGGQPGQGAAATTGDATWLKNFYPDYDWTTIGGAFSSVASALTQVDQAGFYNWSSATMTADVQEWLDNPSSNFGWLLKSDETGIRQAKRYCSKENGVLQNRPVLTVNYGPGIVSTSSFASNLAPGNYTVKVTDATGCTASTSVTITRN